MRDFKGRVAVVTGAASGIGSGLVRRFVAEGMNLVVSDIDQAGLKEVVTFAQDNGAEVAARRVDVGDPEAVEQLASLAYERFGVVHLLCNNAGVLPPDRFRPVWEFSLGDWRWSLEVNLMGVVHGLRSFVPRMLAGGQPGHVVNTASIGGLTSGAHSAPYSVAKHGVVRITEALYASLAAMGSKIGVTALCPGLVRSRMAPTASLSPDQAADMAIQAVRDQRLYVLTTDAYDAAIRDRTDCILERRNPAFPDIRELNKLE